MDAFTNGRTLTTSKILCTMLTLLGVAASAYSEPTRPTDPESLAKRVGMTAIYDEGMSDVVAQGFREDIQYLEEAANQTGPSDQAPEIALMTALQIAIPFLPTLTDYTISGVEYDDPNAERVVFNADETVTLILPDRIGEVAYIDFKARDSEGESMGDLRFNNIRLYENSTLTLISGD